MPFETLLEYSQTKEETIQRLHRLPNVGKKTINELIGLLDKYCQDLPGAISTISGELLIPDAFKSVSIVAFIRSTDCSVRLENALIGAIERNEFPAESLGDLEGKSVQALKSELHRVQNLGRKSVEEFLDLLNTISPESAEGLDSQTGDQAGGHPQSDKIDWAAHYLSLLEKERYGDITVEEIIRKMPGRSKNEDKLLKTLNRENAGIPLSQVLASSSGKLDEISTLLIADTKLTSELESILMDFYQFLFRKSNLKFNHEEYFLHDFSALNEKESKILLSRSGADKTTLEELGKEFGLTRERVRQIESKALKKYIKANRVGLLSLSEDIEKYVKATKGVLPVNVLKSLYGISKDKLEVVLNLVIPENDDSYLSRDGDYLVTSGFRECQEKVFGKIEASIYRQAGLGRKITLQSIEGVNSQILRYFLYFFNKKFSLNKDGEIALSINSASERARIVLAIAGQPIHTSEATRLYKTIFKMETTEHNLGSTFNRLPDALIVGPGTFALYSHLSLNIEDIERIKKEAFELIKNRGQYLSSRIIYEHVRRVCPDLPLRESYFNYYLVHGVLQDDGQYQIKKGFMVGLPSFGDHLSLESEIEGIVENHGPVTITEVIDLLRPTRGELTNGSVRNTLVCSDKIFLTSEQRKWDVAERVFNNASDIRKLKIAIRLAAYKEQVALSSVYNRIRSTGVDYGIGTILSVIWKDPETKRDGDYIGFFGADTELENYYETGEPRALAQLDYRHYSVERSIDTAILDSLVREFDLNV
ncbi:hypothetical protein K0B93_01755 [Marinobacter sp. F4218]|nr:hypothetical protein [Marinobacter sp. F4218]